MPILGKEWRHGFVVSAGNKTTKMRWNKPKILEDDGNLFPQREWYCWWQPEIRRENQLRLVIYPIIYRVLYISKRWLALGFLNHQQNFAYHCWIAVLPMSKITNQPGWLVIWWPFSLCTYLFLDNILYNVPMLFFIDTCCVVYYGYLRQR